MQKLPQDTDALLDAVLALPERHIEWTIARLLDKHPGISTPALMNLVTRRYVRVSQTASAGVGAGAAVPGSGLAIGAALTGVELSVFAANTALYVLTMARLSGIPTQNLEARKTLVLSAILGDEASKLVYDQAGFGIWNWARAQVADNASATLSSVNKALAQFAGKKISKKPFGTRCRAFYPPGYRRRYRVFLGAQTRPGHSQGRQCPDCPAGRPAIGARLEAATFSACPGLGHHRKLVKLLQPGVLL